MSTKQPQTKKEFREILSKAAIPTLRKLGFMEWDNEKPRLFLVPGKFYNIIPEGYPLKDFNRRIHKFKKGKTDDDIRFGVLAYGITR